MNKTNFIFQSALILLCCTLFLLYYQDELRFLFSFGITLAILGTWQIINGLVNLIFYLSSKRDPVFLRKLIVYFIVSILSFLIAIGLNNLSFNFIPLKFILPVFLFPAFYYCFIYYKKI